MPGIGVVLNPYSKRYKRNPDKLDQMSFIIGDKASCKPTQDLADLYRVADDFKSRDIDILAVSGGDGTIHCTLTAFIRVYGEKPLPKITFLRGGTMNLIASTLKIFGTTEELMSRLLVKYHEDQPLTEQKLRLLKINDEYGCIFGNGVVNNFMEVYYKNPNLNPLIAAKTLVHCVGSALVNGKTAMRLFEKFDAEVTVDGHPWPFANYSGIFAASIRQLGLDFNVFRHMINQTDRFHAYGVTAAPRTLIPHLKRLHDGKPSGCQDMIDEAVLGMRIKTEKPMPYTIDGDMLPGQTDVKIECGPLITIVS